MCSGKVGLAVIAIFGCGAGKKRITFVLFVLLFPLIFFLLFLPLTVIQDVDSSLLEGSYQSFASLMEQHLAELFLVAGRHGPRIKRATTVGGCTVQVDIIFYILPKCTDACFCLSK